MKGGDYGVDSCVMKQRALSQVRAGHPRKPCAVISYCRTRRVVSRRHGLLFNFHPRCPCSQGEGFDIRYNRGVREEVSVCRARRDLPCGNRADQGGQGGHLHERRQPPRSWAEAPHVPAAGGGNTTKEVTTQRGRVWVVERLLNRFAGLMPSKACPVD